MTNRYLSDSNISNNTVIYMDNVICYEITLNLFGNKNIKRRKIKKRCMICLNRIPMKDRYFLQCGDFFHEDCIIEWLDKKGNYCPICKITIYFKYNSNYNSEEDREIIENQNIDKYTFDSPSEYSDDI